MIAKIMNLHVLPNKNLHVLFFEVLIFGCLEWGGHTCINHNYLDET